MRKNGIKYCNNCGKKPATTKAEIEKLYGYRISYGKHIEQSWCKTCR